MADAARILDETIAQPRPRYFAFVGSSGLEIGVLGDALASCFDVNLAVWAGAATEIEDQAVRWVGELIGFPVRRRRLHERRHDLEPDGAGRRPRAGAARRRAATGLARPPRGRLLLGRGALLGRSRRPSCSGIGAAGVRALPVDAMRRMRGDATSPRRSIATAPRASTPVAVVATAGTTLTGAVDPIDELADVCAAARRVAPRRRRLRPAGGRVPTRCADAFRGLDRADSVSLDAHKWLYLPKACGVVLVRDREALRAAFAHDEDYLPHERAERHAVDVTLEYSRPFRALKLWLAFRAHGAAAFRGGDRAQPRPGAAAVRRDRPPRRARAAGRAAALDRALPPRARAGVADLDAHNARLAPRAAGRRPRLRRAGRRSTAASTCGRASSTTARPTTTCGRWSRSPREVAATQR